MGTIFVKKIDHSIIIVSAQRKKVKEINNSNWSFTLAIKVNDKKELLYYAGSFNEDEMLLDNIKKSHPLVKSLSSNIVVSDIEIYIRSPLDGGMIVVYDNLSLIDILNSIKI